VLVPDLEGQFLIADEVNVVGASDADDAVGIVEVEDLRVVHIKWHHELNSKLAASLISDLRKLVRDEQGLSA
jgi:hypothetical protein